MLKILESSISIMDFHWVCDIQLVIITCTVELSKMAQVSVVCSGDQESM